CVIFAVFGHVPAPQNVKMHSVNLKNVLKWDPVKYGKGPVTYSVKFTRSIAVRTNFSSIYKDINTTESDLSSVLSPYGNYSLQVKARFQNEESDWAKAPNFNPLYDTIIGPPVVSVASRSGFLDLGISISSSIDESEKMKSNYILHYTIKYWKNATNSKVHMIETTQNSETLSELEPWTSYCVQVVANNVAFNKVGQPSPVICETTTSDGKSPAWLIVFAFVSAMAVITVGVTGIFFIFFSISRITRYIFYPSYNFPEHLKEYLSKPHSTDPFMLSDLKKEHKELCNTLQITSEEPDSCSQHSVHFGIGTEELRGSVKQLLQQEGRVAEGQREETAPCYLNQ
uniref:Interleukin 10 receptor subunit beta n=1 Tax=Latimeria chalumnae TaxID=7897 RepID=H3A666_LATCH